MLLCFTCYSVEFVSVKMDLSEYFSLLHWLDDVDVKLSPCIHYNFRGSWKFGIHKSIEIRLVMKPSFITIPIVAYIHIYELTMYFVNKFFKAPDCILIGKICWAWIVSRIYIFPCLTLVTNWKHLSIKTTPYTLTSVCIFSLLFSIHFQRCWQGEFV